jgi:hypothetical protein
MAGQVMNLLVLIAIGVILADLIANVGGTNALFSGVANIWKIGVNGMLGKPS